MTIIARYPRFWGAPAVALVAVAIGCSGTQSYPGSASVLAVGGSYTTVESLVADRNTCGAVPVQNTTTEVTHSPGSHALSLTHVANTYDGTIDSGGRFATATTAVTSGASQYTVGITGQFTTTGFDALVTVERRQADAPQQCYYIVRWTATKDGPPNTIP